MTIKIALYPNTSQFAVWRRFRTVAVPISLAAALFSIIFSGALAAAHDSPDHVGVHASVLVMENLVAASLLAIMHATYLTLMSFHLIYRFPVEERRTVSRGMMALAYLALAAAYVFHAVHVHDHSSGAHGLFGSPAWSSGAFVLAYATMVRHGIRERLHDDSQSHHPERPLQNARGKWILATDCFVATLASLMLADALFAFDWYRQVADSFGEAIGRIGQVVPFLKVIWGQVTPKDVVIATALCGYGLVKWQIRKKLAPVPFPYLKGSQRIIGEATDWDKVRLVLPAHASVWIDIGSGDGTELRELLQHLYEADDPRYPSEIIFIDRKPELVEQALRASREWLPASTKTAGMAVDMSSEEARAAMARSAVVHLSHVAYHLGIVRVAIRLLRRSAIDKTLLVRFTSQASIYRAVSASMSCAPLGPYIHHALHPLLLADLALHGWKTVHEAVIARVLDVFPGTASQPLVNWIDANYGELSGDIIERYIMGFTDAAKTEPGFRGTGQSALPNADRLVVLTKTDSGLVTVSEYLASIGNRISAAVRRLTRRAPEPEAKPAAARTEKTATADRE